MIRARTLLVKLFYIYIYLHMYIYIQQTYFKVYDSVQNNIQKGRPLHWQSCPWNKKVVFIPIRRYEVMFTLRNCACNIHMLFDTDDILNILWLMSFFLVPGLLHICFPLLTKPTGNVSSLVVTRYFNVLLCINYYG